MMDIENNECANNSLWLEGETLDGDYAEAMQRTRRFWEQAKIEVIGKNETVHKFFWGS